MERLVVRLKDYKNNKIIKKRKVFDNFEECKNYIELLFIKLKENECIRIKFISDKFLSKRGELYTNNTKEELDCAYHIIKEWLSEND